jgi:malonyl-CoA O-methyltransferase
MADATAPERLDAQAVQAWRRRAVRGLMRGEVPWLYDEVARRLQERLAIIRLRPRLWLDASGALGLGVERLRQAYPEARGAVAEPDPAAAGYLRAAWRRPWWRRLGGQETPTVLEAGASWPPGVELVWSNLALHWDPDPPSTIARWHAGAAAGGFVMFSTLGPDTLRELRTLHAGLGWGPIGADPVDMHDIGDMLVQAGFADPVMDQEVLTLTWSDAVRLVADLRAWGVNAAPGRFDGLRTPRWAARWREALGSLAGPDGRLRLSIEVAYGHAFKVDRAPRGVPTGAISVEALRATARERAGGTTRR